MANKVTYQEHWRKLFEEKVDVFCGDFGLSLTSAQIHDFSLFYDFLVRANEHINLTGIIEPEDVALKHIVDSLSCYDSTIFRPGTSILDLGTGAGFPGIPLAIYDRSLKITLFDSLQKRINFLDEVIDLLKLENVTTLHGRAEDFAHKESYREQFDIVATRAVARLPILAEWSLPYVKVNGCFISLKGAAYEEELKEGKNSLAMLGGEVTEVRPITLPNLEDKRAIFYINKIKKSPQKYPRKPKEIKDNPL